MQILNRALNKRSAFTLTQEAAHVMSVKGEKLNIIGVITRDEVNADGECVRSGYALTKDAAFFGSAASFVNKLCELGDLFKEDIEGVGLEVTFDTRETQKGNTIWIAKLV